MKPPPDRYYDVVGWPTVRFTADRVEALWGLDQLRPHSGELIPTDPWGHRRYVRLWRGDQRFDLDRECEHLIEYDARNMAYSVQVPLWVAQAMRLPVAA